MRVLNIVGMDGRCSDPDACSRLEVYAESDRLAERDVNGRAKYEDRQW